MNENFSLGLESFGAVSPHGSVITTGTFDGMHLGHQAILQRLREVSKETGLEPILLTFDPHPRVVVTPDNPPQLLTTLEEKEKFVPCFFDGRVLVLKFDRQLMNMTADQFVTEILLARLQARHLIVGYDHAFGKGRTGKAAYLQELGTKLGFGVEVVQPVMFEGAAVSSTRIRQALADQLYELATKMLGHAYAIHGTVERGIGLGRKLGYPTANVKYAPVKMLPAEGVYACRVEVQNERFTGMMFIGTNHFNPAARVTVEANLFEFDRDIYDEEIVVYPTHWIRENRRYPSTDELVRQIEHDKQIALSMVVTGETTCQ